MANPAWSPSRLPDVADPSLSALPPGPPGVVILPTGITSAEAFGAATVALASPATPLTAVTSVANKLWARADLGVTNTSGTVSGWLDQGPNTKNFGDPGGTSRPSITATDATYSNLQTFNLDGVNDFLQIGTFVLAVPFTIVLICKVITSANGVDICSDTAAAGRIELLNTTGGVYAINPSAGPQSTTGAPAGSWVRIRASFTGTTGDKLKVGSATEVTGANAGSSSLAAFNVSRFAAACNMAIREVVIYGGVPTNPELTALDAYFTAQNAGTAI